MAAKVRQTHTPSPTNPKVIAPLGDIHLQSCSPLTPPDDAGRRRMHKHDECDNIFTKIPDSLFSKATLEFIGFSETKANTIWNMWNNWPTDGPGQEIDNTADGLYVQFLDFACGALNWDLDVSGDDDSQWWSCLQAAGVNEDLRT
ncbi:hypothetical protein GGS20DRAFT_594956 [Poronia punctata]|nr:hypothetical protein GGS20DRAFT_594956 [Poronia punctata]